MYRTYQLTEAERDKVAVLRWDGDTSYYDVFDTMDEAIEEEKRIKSIDDEVQAQKDAYLRSLRQRVAIAPELRN